MTISVWIDGDKKETRQADVAIIGGGISGAAAAYWLSRRTGLRTLIVEQGTIASGASGRSGGFVLRGIFAYYNQAVKTHGRDTARYIFQFNQETQSHLKAFATEHGNSFDLSECGSYLLACSLDELQDLDESTQLMQEDGFDCEYIKQDPIDRNYYGAIHNPGDLAVNPAALTRALIKESGAAVLEREQVFDLLPDADGVLVRTQNYEIKAAKVLLCTNAYTPLLERWFIDKLKPVRGQIIVTAPTGKQVVDKVCYANYGFEYFRMLTDGRFLLGGCREQFKNEETGTYADMITQPVQKALQTYLRDRFPDIAGTNIDFRWSGLMAFTPDGLPVIGELPPLPNVFYAVGCNAHGLGYSLSLSKLLTEVALDGAMPGVFGGGRLPPTKMTQELRKPGAAVLQAPSGQ